MSRTRFTLPFDLHNMVPGPAGTATVQNIYKSEDGILHAYGTTVPADASSGYSPGCLFHHIDGTGNDNLYINEGTNTSCDFNILISQDNVMEEIQENYLASTADSGPSPLLWDNAKLLEVILDPTKGYYFFTDFFEGDYTTAASLWTVTQRTSGSIANDATNQGGGCTIDAGAATAAQGVTCQMHGISIKPEADTTIRIEWRCKIDEDDGRVMMGLGAVGTTNWVSTDTIATNADCAVFYRDAGTGATDWSVQISDGSTAQATDDAFTGSDEGYEYFGIKIIGDGAAATDSVTFYHNGVADSITTDVSDMPDAVMVPTFESNADGTDQPVINIDWLRILVTNDTDGSRA